LIGDNIVCWENVLRYYGNNPELVEKYRKIKEGGECPFCPAGLKKEYKLAGETDFWSIVYNQFPYKNSELHLLVIPKRHLISLSELSPEEWVQMPKAICIANVFPYTSKEYGLAIRVGEIGGVTLYHLHWHFIVPKFGKGRIPVNFGIG